MKAKWEEFMLPTKAKWEEFLKSNIDRLGWITVAGVTVFIVVKSF
jgi:hypothetical protein